MFAQFGMPGHIELLVIGALGLAMLGGPLLLVIIVIVLVNRQNRHDRNK